ncbi:MAG: hypothetical protein ACRD16_07170 [Thermoanaerobaculia bacterium]
METAVGIFSTQAEARRAAKSLISAGTPAEHINILTPEDWKEDVGQVPLSDTEAPGTAAAIGGLVGGAAGASAGYLLGPLVAALFVPGVGTIAAIGVAGAALLGLGGAAAGAAGGEAIESSLSDGLPHDELFLYEDALRGGRSVVVVLADHHDSAQKARAILASAGADSIDAAREKWWIGLRDVARSEFQGGTDEFPAFEKMYRCGFEAAQRAEFRGKRFDDAKDGLRRKYLDSWENEAFRRGFERAQQMSREKRGAPASRS